MTPRAVWAGHTITDVHAYYVATGMGGALRRYAHVSFDDGGTGRVNVGSVDIVAQNAPTDVEEDDRR